MLSQDFENADWSSDKFKGEKLNMWLGNYNVTVSRKDEILMFDYSRYNTAESTHGASTQRQSLRDNEGPSKAEN